MILDLLSVPVVHIAGSVSQEVEREQPTSCQVNKNVKHFNIKHCLDFVFCFFISIIILNISQNIYLHAHFKNGNHSKP